MQSPKTQADILNLIYSNGCNMPATIVFHQDSGHGWLQVQKGLVINLGILKDISECSYVNDDSFFLEEDCDMAVFSKAIDWFAKDISQGFWQKVPSEYEDYSFIRNFPRHKPALQTNLIS